MCQLHFKCFFDVSRTPAVDAVLYNPQDIAINPAGDLYIADLFSYVIRLVTKSTGIISTFAGTGGVVGSTGEWTAAVLERSRDEIRTI